MKLLIGADLVPTQSNIELFAKADIDTLLGDDLKKLLSEADYRIFNLEIPLTDELSPIHKCGPALIAPTNTATGLKAVGVDLFTISNNHILDQGVQGLYSTVEALKRQGIQYVGAGENLEAAAKPHVFTLGNKRIGVYACAEHEFSIAMENTPGANPFDALESPDHVAALKKQCDYVVVLYHGGKEHYRYPSPMLQKVCRKLVEKGADLVVCQHSHCIGCREEFQGGTIVYGQGNFLFDYSKSEYWQASLLIQVNDDLSVSYIPLVKADMGVRLAEGTAAEEILNHFDIRSREITQPGAIESLYKEFADGLTENYLTVISGKDGFWFRALNKLLDNRLRIWRSRRRYNRAGTLSLQNYVECEAHRELLVQMLKNRTSNN